MCDLESMTTSDSEVETERISTAFSCYDVQRSVLQHLQVLDLKTLRLVNRLWGHSAFYFLQDKTHVTLDSPKQFESYLHFLLNPDKELDKGFVCFSNYKIVIKKETFESCRQAVSLFAQFWDVCSTFVKGLHLSCPWTCVHPLLTLIFYTVGRGPPLEKLSLSVEDVTLSESEVENWGQQENDNSVPPSSSPTFYSDHSQSGTDKPKQVIPSLVQLQLKVSIVLSADKAVFPFSWSEFFEQCPNLRHLSIQSDYASGHFCRIVGVLAEKGVKLVTLKIGTRDQRLFSEEFLRKLAHLSGNETTTVSLGFLPSVRHNTSLDDLLLKAASSLKTLSLLQYRTSNQSGIQAFSTPSTTSTFHGFPHLSSLRITKELLPNLNILTKIPNLRRLEIYRDSTIGQHDELSNPVIRTRSLSAKISSLKTLVLEPFLPVDHVWKVVRWFPNVETVQMKANDVIARVIFMSWIQLRELYLIAELTRDNNDIVRSTLTDEGITGLSRDVLQEFVTGRGFRGFDVRRMERMPYIGNLSNLEMCKLQVVPDYQTGLTDHSVHFGLLDLPKLQSVTLIKSLVSPAAVDTLRRQGIAVTKE